MGLGGAALLVAVVLVPCLCQKLPSRDDHHFNFHISRPEIFYDTKLLADGAQVTTYMLKHITRRFFFTVEEADTTVAITVTPCSSTVKWTLSLREPLLDEEEEDYAEEWDPLKKQAASIKPAGLGDVWSYTGNQRSTYATSASPAGTYILALETTEYDSTVLLYATTTPHSDLAYPELPGDAAVTADEIGTETVSLSWKASPSRSHAQPLEYCVSVNTRRHLHSRCAATAAIHGDLPPEAPPNAGFGFAWEKEGRKFDRSPNTLKPSPETYLTCIGDKTSYTVNNLLPGKRYYMDVFVVNKVTNHSTAYHGARVKTQPSRKRIRIKDGKVVTAFIKGGKGSNLFHYKLKKPNSINVVIQPCFGELKVVITKDGETIVKKEVRDFENISVVNATAGRYFIEVSSVARRSAYFKVVVSRKRKRITYPRLPGDKTIRVYDNNRNACDALTVAWLATDKKYQYCLFVQELDDSETSLKRILRRWNKCMDPNARKRTEKVMCRNVRFKDKKRAVMVQQIRNLKPNKKYIVDVYAKRLGRNGLSLSYNSQLISTRNSC